MKYVKSFYNFKIGEKVFSTAFNKFYKVVGIEDYTLWIEDEDGNIAEFLKKDFVPEIDWNINKYNI